jgi:hypothetical protein
MPTWTVGDNSRDSGTDITNSLAGFVMSFPEDASGRARTILARGVRPAGFPG